MSDTDVLQEGTTFDRIAEQSAVGSMLLNLQAVWDVSSVVQPTDFYDPRHEVIVRAVLGLAHRNEPTDPVSVVSELERLGVLARAGGAAYVFELQGVPSTWHNAGHYAGVVLARSVRRSLAAAGEAIVQMGNGDGDVFEHVEAARARVEAVTNAASRTDVRPVGDSFMQMVDELSAPPKYVETPWKDLNYYIGGFRPGCLYVIGARPACGKSMVALQSALRLSRFGSVAFASLEMSVGDLQKRLISMLGEVHMGALMNANLTDTDWKKIARVQNRIMESPIFINDNSSMNITQIKAYARSVARKGNLAGVVVDYLQLMSSPEGGKINRQEVVADFSRQLKILAKELQVPVIALSQLNRQSEARADRKPTLADLRESGAIEQDADVVLLLHRDENDVRKDRQLNVIVAKNRHGSRGDLELLWQGEYARVVPKGSVAAPPPPVVLYDDDDEGEATNG